MGTLNLELSLSNLGRAKSFYSRARLEPQMILTLFLIFCQSEPRDSYKKKSDKQIVYRKLSNKPLLLNPTHLKNEIYLY